MLSAVDDSGLSTSRTLLERVRLRDSEAWHRFVLLYGPTVYGWLRRASLQPHDAADVVQEVFQAVATNIERFQHGRPGDTFRGWLRTIAGNKVRDFYRRMPRERVGGEAIEELLARTPEMICADEPDEAKSQLARRALELIQTDFERRTWQAFLSTAVAGRSAAETAAELGMTVAAVHKAKSRVLLRLRTELEGLSD